MQSIRNLALFIFCLAILSCSQAPSQLNYSQDALISDSQGHPIDSDTYYFPTPVNTKEDEAAYFWNFDQRWFSVTLYAAKEPVLSNFYLGYDVYRFLWLRSFHKPTTISLHNDGARVWLVTKQLDRQPEFLKAVLPTVMFDPPQNGNNKHRKLEPADSLENEFVVLGDRTEKIFKEDEKELSLSDWDEFQRMLLNYHFWLLTPFQDATGIDGSRWTIEAHLSPGYWYVSRWSPDGEFKSIGEWLIRKSGLEEMIY